MFEYLKNENINFNIAKYVLIQLYQHPQMDFESILSTLKYKRRTKEELTAPIGFLKEKYKEIGKNKDPEHEADWVLGEIRKQALGNIDLTELRNEILNS